MKKILMIKKVLLCSIGFLLAGCSSNSSMDKYSSDYSSRPNSNTSNKYSSDYSSRPNSNTSNKYSSDYSSRPNRNTSNKIDGEQAVVDYLVSHGSSEYNLVSTGNNTLLGYKDGDFFLRCDNKTSSSYLNLAIGFTYFSTRLFGQFIISNSSSTTFKATLYYKVFNHKYDSVDSSSLKIQISNYYSEDDIKTISALIIRTGKSAINNASDFLSSHGLPYVF